MNNKIALVGVAVVVLIIAGLAVVTLQPGTPNVTTQVVTQTATKTEVQTQTATQTQTKTQTTTIVETPAEPKHLVIAVSQEGPTYGFGLDARWGSAGFRWTSPIMRSIYDSLVFADLGNSPVPGLAESWQVIDDTTFVFQVRQGVKFHDGTELDAHAVKFTFDASLDQDKPNNVIYRNVKNIQSVDVIDKYSFKITLKKPDADFLLSLADHTGIVSPTAAQKQGDQFGFHPVGTGPFKFVEWISNDHLTMVANDDYWDGRPKIDKLTVRIVPDSSVRVLGLEKGDWHIIEVPPEQVGAVKDNDKVNFLQGVPTSFYFLNINGFGDGSIAPLANTKVRQAINYAIDRNAMIQTVENGYGIPAITSVHPGFKDYWNPDLKKYPDGGDIAKAQQLLTEAGYPDGFKVVILGAPYLNFDKMAVVLQQQLQKAGFDVEVQSPEFGVVANKLLRTGEWSLAVHDRNVPDMLPLYDMHVTGSIWNMGKINNPELESLLDQQRSSYVISVRRPLVDAAQTMILEEGYGAYLYYPIRLHATATNVDGYEIHPHPRWIFLVHKPSIGLEVDLVQ